MLRKTGFAILVIALLAIAALLAVLVPSHLAVRRERAPLPTLDAVRRRVAGVAGGPRSLRWINTSSQVSIRGLSRADPHADRPFRLCHSTFVLEWPDRRIVLLDLGMTRERAATFGSFGELLGGEPARIHTTVAETLGDRIADVAGIVFTHLHIDHVDGIRDLCAAHRGDPIPVFMTPAQARRPNHTTSGGLQMIRDAACVRIVELEDTPLAALEGLAGVFVTAAGGHTPGTQIITAVIGDGAERAPVAFTGDIVNHIDGIDLDIGKSLIYRTLIVPESEDRQRELRAYLRSLRAEAGFALRVSHDEDLLSAALPRFAGSATP